MTEMNPFAAPKISPEARRASLAGSTATLAGRLMMASLFVVEGYGKMFSYADVQSYMLQFGVDPRLLPLGIATEFGGGILIGLGAFSRWTSLALAGFCVLTAILFHRGADADAAIQLRKNLALAGGFLVLAAHGGGAWSVDAWRRAPRKALR